jgi:hypothetical protein
MRLGLFTSIILALCVLGVTVLHECSGEAPPWTVPPPDTLLGGTPWVVPTPNTHQGGTR